MQIHRLNPGFSTADAGYPSISSSPGKLNMAFNNSSSRLVLVEFSGVPAFRWQEGELPLAPGEPYDGSCELFGTEWLSQHTEGRTMNSGPQLRHLRFNFNAWGSLDVLCSSFSVRA